MVLLIEAYFVYLRTVADHMTWLSWDRQSGMSSRELAMLLAHLKE